MALTEMQKLARDSQGNVIVSAGAGSGKTKVLTDRIVLNICERGVKLDEILILTFANGAANEMRVRLKTELGKLDDKRHLVPLVDSANICTFDAYFLYLVKKYCYKLGVSNDVNLIPDDIVYVQKDKVLEGFLQNMADNPTEIDKIIFENYCLKDYRLLKKVLIEIDKALADVTDFDALIDQYNTKFLTKDAIQNFLEGPILNNFKARMNEALILLNQISDDDKYVNSFKKKFEPLLANLTLQGFMSFFSSYRAVSVNKKCSSLYLETKINKSIKEIKDGLCAFNLDDVLETDLKYNQIVVPYLLKIVKNLREKINEFKHLKNSFTFDDIAKMAFNLLKENEDVRSSIKNKLKLIMIDEYQDTSKFQEEFINMIENNNVFVVGDVKQSIYAFRGANPQQFMDKYDRFEKVKNETQALKAKNGITIDMNTNFRSRDEITRDINTMFSDVMTLEYGGADYAVSHVIEHGNKAYEEKGKTDNKHGIFYLNYVIPEKSNSKIEADIQIQKMIENIKVRINSKMEVFDRDLGIKRPCEYKDFAILVAASSLFKDIEKAFNEAGIPINAVYDEDIRSDDSVKVLINILKLINEFNSENKDEVLIKHAFIGILRSFIYAKKDPEIYDLSQNEAYKTIPEYKFIEEFAKNHKDNLIHDIYIDILNDFNFLDRLPTIGNAINKLKFNKIFFDRTILMDDFGYDLKDFINYLSLLEDLDLKMQSRNTSDAKNAVTLTTIHKSKGLQYGIVYMPFTLKKPKSDTVDVGRFFINKDYGIYLPSLVQKDNKSIHTLLKDFYISSTKPSELIRLLYVALTRAQEEVCILKGTKENELDTENNSDFDASEEDLTEYSERKATEEYADDLYSNYKKQDLLKTITKIGDIFTIYGWDKFPSNEFENLVVKDDEIKEKITTNDKIKISNYRYNFEKLPARKHASKVSSDIANANNLAYGTHLHLLLEAVDFKTKDTSFIKDKLEKSRVDNVLKNPIFNNLENAIFYKEYEYYDDINDLTGIIDLLIEKEDELIVIDYKTKNIDDKDYDKQITYYKNYVSKVFNKPTKGYLLSIIDNKVREVK